MPLQTYKANDGKLYTVDYRLRQFRHVPAPTPRVPFGIIEFIGFKDWKGNEILCEMLDKKLVPSHQLNSIV